MNEHRENQSDLHRLGKRIKSTTGVFLDNFFGVRIVLQNEIDLCDCRVFDGPDLEIRHGGHRLDFFNVIHCFPAQALHGRVNPRRFVNVDLGHLVAVVKIRGSLFQQIERIVDLFLISVESAPRSIMLRACNEWISARRASGEVLWRRPSFPPSKENRRGID